MTDFSSRGRTVDRTFFLLLLRLNLDQELLWFADTEDADQWASVETFLSGPVFFAIRVTIF